MIHAYLVSESFDWKGTRLHRGDVLRGDDARELEQPENAELLRRCTRVPDAAFAHHDVATEAAPTASEPTPALAPSPAPAPADAATTGATI
jgi:hypothetical protein